MLFQLKNIPARQFPFWRCTAITMIETKAKRHYAAISTPQLRSERAGIQKRIFKNSSLHNKIADHTSGEHVMKDKLLIWLIGVGLVIAYIGIKFENPIVIGLLLGSVGIYGIVSGIQMIISK